MPAFPVKLVCPSCRKPGPERHLTVVFLEPVSPEPRAAPDAAADRCPRCNRSYPRIDGIRCAMSAFPPAARHTTAHRLRPHVPAWVARPSLIGLAEAHWRGPRPERPRDKGRRWRPQP